MDYIGWKREVTVTWSDQWDGHVWLWDDSGLKRILITVTSPATAANPSGIVTKRFGLRSVDGPLEQAQLATVVVVTQIEATLEVYAEEQELPRDENDPTIESRGITNLLNHVESPNAN